MSTAIPFLQAISAVSPNCDRYLQRNCYDHIFFTGPTHEQDSEVNCTLINKMYAALGPMVSRVLPPPAAPAMRPYSSIDGCKNYHNLSSHDRSVDHSDWSSYRCDMFLYGWYRFTGQSGRTLVNSCPAGWSKSSSSCGTFYKGWLKDQFAPSIEDGVVNRTVCFSTHGSCTCTLRREIKMRNCGGFLVYYFDAVPTCNARYCGKPGANYFDKLKLILFPLSKLQQLFGEVLEATDLLQRKQKPEFSSASLHIRKINLETS